MRENHELYSPGCFGCGALALLNFTTPYTGLSLGWSAWTIGAAGVFAGLPGTVLLVVLKILYCNNGT